MDGNGEVVDGYEKQNPCQRIISQNDSEINDVAQDQIEEALENVGLVPPPDGGYGWVIVGASFLCNVIVDGVIFTAGDAFQQHWKEDYNTSTGTAAWIVSLMSGFYLLVGPFVSAFANMFGCRRVTMVGTVLAFIGFLTSMVAPHIVFLYFTFGILGGVGFGLIYLPSIVIISQYFSTKRALATGIATCGSGIGTFVFAPFIQYLLTQYNWSQTLLILSAVVLNGLICGMLFTDPPMVQQTEDVAELVEEAIKNAESGLHLHITDSSPTHAESHTKTPIAATDPESPNVTAGVNFERFNGRSRTLSERPFISSLELNARRRNASILVGPTSTNAMSRNELTKAELKAISAVSVTQLNRPFTRMDAFYTGSRLQLEKVGRTRGDSFAQDAAKGVTVLSCQSLDQGVDPDDIEAVVMNIGSLRNQLLQILRQICDTELMRSPTFIVFAIAGFLTLTAFFVPYIYLRQQAMAIGCSSESATLLIQLLGVTNIVGRLASGFLADRPNIDPLLVHNIAVTLAGVGTVFVPFYTQYWMLCIYCIVFGFGAACFATLRSIICVQLLGLQKLSSAFGGTLLFMGIAALFGSPIAGSIADATGNLDASFYVTGSLLTLSGLICFPLKRLSQREFGTIIQPKLRTRTNSMLRRTDELEVLYPTNDTADCTDIHNHLTSSNGSVQLNQLEEE